MYIHARAISDPDVVSTHAVCGRTIPGRHLTNALADISCSECRHILTGPEADEWVRVIAGWRPAVAGNLDEPMAPRVGDFVDVTMRNARVVGLPKHGGAPYSVIVDGTLYRVPQSAQLAQVDPEGWPPRPGDLWREGPVHSGCVWFATKAERVGLRMHNPFGEVRTPDALARMYGPITLEHRED